MVQEPYVNHIPTITGGIGREKLSYFYVNHFIFANPDNTEMELISRTIGIDRVVNEFIYKFTHEKQVDWLLPGVPPTGKYVQIPMTAIVNIRGHRLYEHILWDQGSALVQCRLMPEYLPFLKPGANGEKLEYRERPLRKWGLNGMFDSRRASPLWVNGAQHSKPEALMSGDLALTGLVYLQTKRLRYERNKLSHDCSHFTWLVR